MAARGSLARLRQARRLSLRGDHPSRVFAMNEHWIAERMRGIEVSGIRRVFDLAANLKDPVNLSIGQPHFPVPTPVKEAAKAAIDLDRNGYTVTQGIAELRAKILADVRRRQPTQS